MQEQKGLKVEDEIKRLQDKSFKTADQPPNDPEAEEVKHGDIIPVKAELVKDLSESAPRTDEDFRELDRRDEEQIIAEMEGKILKEYFYSFQSEGRTVVGISNAGIKGLARRMGNITLELVKQWDDEQNFYAIVKAHDHERNLDMLGGSQTAKKRSYFNKYKNITEEKDNPFALATTITKASRNAIRGLIQEKVITAMYEEWQRKSGY